MRNDMDRRGKFLLLVLESGDKIILHLRMTGCLLVTLHDDPQEKHTHIIFIILFSLIEILKFSSCCIFCCHPGHNYAIIVLKKGVKHYATYYAY